MKSKVKMPITIELLIINFYRKVAFPEVENKK